MKINQIALALIGLAASAAQAQSSVTVYGLLDLGASRINRGTSFLNGLPVGLTGSPGVWNLRPNSSNRIGFRGTEDLGDGLRANFSIEHRLDPSVGLEQSGQNGFWRGHSWVGLSSTRWGEVRLGRQQNAALFVAIRGDPWNWDYNVASVQVINRAGNPATYTANMVTYNTPSFGGVVVKAEYGFKENGPTDTTGNPNRTVGANVQYTRGPLYLGVGFNDIRIENSAAKNRYAVATMNYDFGIATGLLQYTQAKNNSTETSKSFTVGARVPVGQGQIKAVVSRYNPAGVNNDTTKVGLGYDYFLSKRTRTTGFETGVRHIF
jgi:predicted porin